jgi:hypothetical protein
MKTWTLVRAITDLYFVSTMFHTKAVGKLITPHEHDRMRDHRGSSTRVRGPVGVHCC